MTPDHHLRLTSYFVFFSGLLPKSVWGFLLQAYHQLHPLFNVAYEGGMYCLNRNLREVGGGVDVLIMAVNC